eukprot:snap_masked-scaffold_24-processed-gene-4.16-mRNA-1 protein AED:0.20 eAED:0.21 QI:0/0/0/0.33/1/1/3/0/470
MSDIDSPLQDHLTHLGSQQTRRRSQNPVGTRQRRARRHDSIASTTSSLQNVTKTLSVRNIDTEISETRKSIKNLEREIVNVKRNSLHSLARYSLNSDIETSENEDKDQEFEFRHSRPRSYKPFFSLFFLFSCLILFIVEIGRNGWAVEELHLNPLIGPSVDVLVDLGAKDTEKLQNGEFWRLFAPLILHSGLIHLLANLLGLVTIGIPMEQEFGTVRIAIISIFSGVAGITLSALMAPNLIGVGASSAIFGLFGAAWADLIQNWKTYAGKNVGILIQLFLYTVINFSFGLMPFLDNFAHIGGFIVGLLIGMSILSKNYGDVNVSRTKKMFVRLFSGILFPAGLAGLLLMLFLGFEVADNCEFCEYLTCVEFPPGAAEGDLWWECGPCLNGFGSFSNFSESAGVNIICPDETEVFVGVPVDLTLEEFETNFIYLRKLIEKNKYVRIYFVQPKDVEKNERLNCTSNGFKTFF